MTTVSKFNIEIIDLVAVIWFLTLWVSYAYFADYRPKSKGRMLVNVMYRHRLNWMKEMLKRDNRMVDATVAKNVMSSITFFASTSIFLLAGLLTLLGNSSQGMGALSKIPFVKATTEPMWEIKIICLMAIFTYGFFKHTWAMRQFNYTSILIVGAPVIKEPGSKAELYAEQIAKILSLAAANFNNGLRAYYFGLAALTWFLHPYIFMFCTALVVYVLFRREIRSKTLKILNRYVE